MWLQKLQNESVAKKTKTILHKCMYKDALNGLFITDTAESPLISRVTGNKQ